MPRQGNSPFTPKQVASYLKDQITTRGEGGLKTAFTMQFFGHFDSVELEGMIRSMQSEIEERAGREIEELRALLEAKSGKSVHLS